MKKLLIKKSLIKKSLAYILITLLSFIAVVGGAVMPNNVRAAEAEKVVRTISISGSYVVKVAPDIAYIDISVKTFHADVVKAQEENRVKMNNVMNQLKKLEIEDKDIRTVDYRIQPRYERKKVESTNELGTVETKNEQVLVGYDVINSIKVTVQDLQKVGKVVDVTVKEGVNEANQIAFGLSETTKNQKYLEALKGAVENGKAKAETIASVFGINLGIPASISEAGAYFPSPIIYKAMGSSGGVAAYDTAESTPISGGEMEIRANVNIVYEY